MRKIQYFGIFLFYAAILSLVIVSCIARPTGGKVNSNSLADGTYSGSASSFPNSAEVEVTIKAGKITGIKLKRHISSWIGNKAEAVTSRIIASQSSKVDAVTGATNSSSVIMNAVENALQKSRKAKSHEDST